MLNSKKIIVILPAYNAGLTLEKTYNEIPFNIVDDVILTDDYSSDNTIKIAKNIGIKHLLKHSKNKGYGANQKTCYAKAKELNADIVIMLHPDYQYTPKLIPAMCELIVNGTFDVVLGSRILSKGALQGGMPVYKYVANRVLTLVQNILMNQKLSEYHTGYRAFKMDLLNSIDYKNNSDNFVFDNELLAQCCYKNARIGEISCPTKYFEEASSINFSRSVIYGLGCLRVAMSFFLQRIGIYKFNLFK